MRKRLRKKVRIGEFKELAFPVAFRLNPKLDEDAVEGFIAELVEAVEARNLAFVGSGHHDWYGSLAAMGRNSATEDDQAFVSQLLSADERVEAVVVGELQDAWHNQDTEDPALPEPA